MIGGTAHAELIDGRGGADILTGSAGNDAFAFSAAYAAKTLQGAARIMDFKDGFDLIEVRGGLGFGDLVIGKSSEGTVVSLANGDVLVVLVGVDTASVNASNFPVI
jgi:Ca2+-binding RTX toxin-like protein